MAHSTWQSLLLFLIHWCPLAQWCEPFVSPELAAVFPSSQFFGDAAVFKKHDHSFPGDPVVPSRVVTFNHTLPGALASARR